MAFVTVVVVIMTPLYRNYFFPSPAQISNNGHFYFADYEWTYFNYRTFPEPDYPYQNDPAIIAPFYARVDILPTDDRQRIYWRWMKRDLTIDDPGESCLK